MTAARSEAAARAACRDKVIEFLFNADARLSQPRIELAAHHYRQQKRGSYGINAANAAACLNKTQKLKWLFLSGCFVKQLKQVQAAQSNVERRSALPREKFQKFGCHPLARSYGPRQDGLLKDQTTNATR